MVTAISTIAKPARMRALFSTDPTLRPFYHGRHGGEDGLHIAAGFQAEGCAAIIEQVELDIASALDELFFAFVLGPRLAHAGGDEGRI